MLAFARALGEYGSVIFIAGNMPMKSEITPLLIMIKLEQYDYAGATAIALGLPARSFALLLLINFSPAWAPARTAEGELIAGASRSPRRDRSDEPRAAVARGC